MDSETALEYLMSYGWILLVVAIVGGAIYTTVTEGPNVEVFEYKEATCFMSNNIEGEGFTCMPTSQVERGVAN